MISQYFPITFSCNCCKICYLPFLRNKLTANRFIWIPDDVKYGTSCAPSVLIYFIDMMLYSDPEEVVNCDQYMYDGQKTVQTIFILVALLMIPIMLFGKPVYHVMTRKKHQTQPPVRCSQWNASVHI